jgi:hypothetical protein
VFIAASFVASGSAASAQHSPAARPADVGGPVLRSADVDALRAAVRRAGAQLIQSSPPVPQTKNEQWVVRHPVIVGALIGTGAGAALSRIEAIGGRSHDPRVALMGTGVGAWGGLIASAAHKARSKEKVGVGTKIGIAAGAVGLIVLPVLACYGAGGCGGSS